MHIAGPEKAAAVAEARKTGVEEMLEEVKAVATREKGELVKAVNKTQPVRKVVATTRKASKVGVTQAD